MAPPPDTSTAAGASDLPTWYNNRTPEDQLAYWKARDDYNKAAADYRAAVAKADEDLEKTLQVHKDAKKASIKANEAVTDAVAAADAARVALAELVNGYQAEEVGDAASAKQQGDKLQELLEAYKKALASLVAARGEADAKLKILNDQSKSTVTDPKAAEIKAETLAQATAQHAMDVAKAEIPREAAEDLLAVKEAELQARLPREKRPDTLESSV